jgi:hypothetical protein
VGKGLDFVKRIFGPYLVGQRLPAKFLSVPSEPKLPEADFWLA